MLHKEDGKRSAKPYAHLSCTALKRFARNKPMVNLRIGPNMGHLFYATLGLPRHTINLLLHDKNAAQKSAFLFF